MKLLFNNWLNEFESELPVTSTLRIISPFLSKSTVVNLSKKFSLENLELITRFNLNDFSTGVSDLEAINFIYQNGGKIFGVKGLHSKVYIFDNRKAIVSSSNFTENGLVKNHEAGILIRDLCTIDNLLQYYNNLKTISNEFNPSKYATWKEELVSNPASLNFPIFNDYGGIQPIIDQSKNYYIKFFGAANDRVALDFQVQQEVDDALCHYACGFSINKRPRQIKSGDIIYMARMTKNPNDYAIFGKAIAIEHNDKRDIATDKEIVERSWKKDYPVYLRVRDSEFIDTIMRNCPFMEDLINDLNVHSFASTIEKHKNGEQKISIRRSYARKPYVKLSFDGAAWLENRFSNALISYGKIDSSFIESLPSSINV
ncbi:phospholipase D-like domain-containing protein [Haliscomenobacter hydrossis]|uniref:PLD phosphodiesterase domain-containing protein n=1 Tax=Haliscomenobacter hydrossis (strain ATCC 27775 / DSM 1100 / LMG 10767 / O) TaxID=760192 RepID=F4L668_HALH1|nr:phospholipase D-like domain-containing protein [Haliscomenobacter hydrossis]AEE54086.1 hypothetical protein Halhy_6266 [Haliscomenobacter hydrossis DSM 1100]